MTKKDEAERSYEIIGRDAQTWLTQAIELRFSAEVFLPKIEYALALPPNSPEVQARRFAFIHSYMFLNGLAFENLIKGIIIGREPNLATKVEIDREILDRKGHGIASGARKIISVTAQEDKLLQRMEEYLVWAGRYPLPLKFEAYSNSETKRLRQYRSNDPVLINQLFEKLQVILQREWEERERLGLNR